LLFPPYFERFREWKIPVPTPRRSSRTDPLLRPLCPPIKPGRSFLTFERDFIDDMSIAIESEPSLRPFRDRFSPHTQLESDQRKLSRWERLEAWRWLITIVVVDYTRAQERNDREHYEVEMRALRRERDPDCPF
jgi:hypothetical protein